MGGTIQAIFSRHFEAFAAEQRLPLRVHKAARAIINCRTEAMGGHVMRCPAGHVEQISYNSCKHRSCPQCSSLPKERWLEKQKAQLLACNHFHVIFTIPDKLHDLWRWNRKVMAELLIRASHETLFELLDDKRYLGAKPGLIISLQTWSRTLTLHPHTHCLITGGGIDADGNWQKSRRSFLLHIELVRTLYMKKMIALITKAFYKGSLRLPDDMRKKDFFRLRDRLYKIKWNIGMRGKYGHGEGVAIYLARYIKGGPITNRSVIRVDEGHIWFCYTDNKDKRRKVLPLTHSQFFNRLLQHVPIPYSHMVRYYGHYHPHNIDSLNRCREQMGQPPVEPLQPMDWSSYCEKIGVTDQITCPVCGRRYIYAGPLKRGKPPPERERHGTAA
jgi:hypothetical protein